MREKSFGGAMETSPAQPVPKEFSDQWDSWQLIKLSNKLRWIGMEREAELVMRALVGRSAVSSSVAGPADTD
jgi:hypothetical protein